MDSPISDRSSRKIHNQARRAFRAGEFNKLEAARKELRRLDSASASKALRGVQRLIWLAAIDPATTLPAADARKPCLYAVEMKEHPHAAVLYVGMSRTHPASCRASIHLGGCRRTGLKKLNEKVKIARKNA